jgi:hypothetical protein
MFFQIVFLDRNIAGRVKNRLIGLIYKYVGDPSVMW